MEAGFGTSFGDVRVHTGGAAVSSTSALRAEAFTSGTNIAFAPGRYNPGSKSGEGLIAPANRLPEICLVSSTRSPF